MNWSGQLLKLTGFKRRPKIGTCGRIWQARAMHGGPDSTNPTAKDNGLTEFGYATGISPKASASHLLAAIRCEVRNGQIYLNHERLASSRFLSSQLLNPNTTIPTMAVSRRRTRLAGNWRRRRRRRRRRTKNITREAGKLPRKLSFDSSHGISDHSHPQTTPAISMQSSNPSHDLDSTFPAFVFDSPGPETLTALEAATTQSFPFDLVDPFFPMSNTDQLISDLVRCPSWGEFLF
jgi:hypothetical protein